jgi:hypothetical protein
MIKTSVTLPGVFCHAFNPHLGKFYRSLTIRSVGLWPSANTLSSVEPVQLLMLEVVRQTL